MRFVDTALDSTEDCLGTWLRPRLATATTVAIRTGFLTLSGLEEILSGLGDVLDRGGRIHLVAGGTPEQADPNALKRLLSMSQAADEAMTVHLVTDPALFHNAKTYYLEYPGGRSEAWVGSANLTRPGLVGNHETGIVLDSETDPARVIDDIYAGILHYQTHAAAPLDAETLAHLTGHSPDSARVQPTRFAATVPIEDLLQPAIDEADALASEPSTPRGITTGFADLDALTNGLGRGTLTIIGSRPGVGSSTLARDFLRHAAVNHGWPSAFYAAAETTTDITHKILSAEARVRFGDIRGARMTNDDWIRLIKRSDAIADAPLHINHTPTPGLDGLVRDITRLRHDVDLQLAIIDPLASIASTVEPSANREREIATIIRRLKSLALELDVPLVVTADLGRGPEYRNHQPLLSDLGESDTIARAADNVILIHRPDAHDRDALRMGEADLILAKHRNGPTSTITVAHQLHYSRFVDMAPE